MTSPPGKYRFKFQKKFMAFFGIVPLLLATAMIKVPCPVCDGSGSVSSTGMEGVVISGMNSITVSVSLNGCNNYRLLDDQITLVLYNNSTRDAHGYVNLYLLDYAKSTILDTQFTVVDVPAGNEVTDLFDIYFKVNTDTVGNTRVTAEVVGSNIPCKACNGTGAVSLNAWPLYNGMKNNLKETQRILQPYNSPLLIPAGDAVS